MLSTNAIISLFLESHKSHSWAFSTLSPQGTWFPKVLSSASSCQAMTALPHTAMCFLQVKDQQLPETWKCWENSPIGKCWVEQTQWQHQSFESQILHRRGVQCVINKNYVHLVKDSTDSKTVMIALQKVSHQSDWSWPPEFIYRLLHKSPEQFPKCKRQLRILHFAVHLLLTYLHDSWM